MTSKAVKRIYVVTETKEGGDPVHSLVKAASQAQAIGHMVRGRFKAEAAGADDVVTLMGNGMKVEDAGAEPAAE